MLPFAATWMAGLGEVNKGKQRQMLYDITYMENLKYKTN